MKSYIKIVSIWIGLSVLMMVFWIIGLMIGNIIFPGSLAKQTSTSEGNATFLLFITCLLNTSVLLYFIYNARCKGLKLAGTIFLFTFGVQYFMSQIETLWFNDAVKFPVRGIYAIVVSGIVQTFLFSLTATWITGRFKFTGNFKREKVPRGFFSVIIRILLLSVMVWPVIYFLAGYFIAWQFKAVRQFYSGTTQMSPFFSIMKENFISGLFFFQIFRGVLWILIVFPALMVIKGSIIKKGIILGLLIAVLGGSQLLIPNPFMSEQVRMAHLIETSSSNFLWGFIIVWGLTLPLKMDKRSFLI